MRRLSDISIAASSRRTHGTAALELVVVLPVLIMLVLGAADLGRALYFENLISNAARVGAAYGATHQFTDYTYADWESRVVAAASEEAANLPEFDRDALTVVVTTADEPDGDVRISVETAYPFELLLNWPTLPDRLLLQHTVSMRSYR